MGRVIGFLVVLNVILLGVGLGMEQVRGEPDSLVDFNADKVRLLGRVEAPTATTADDAVPDHTESDAVNAVDTNPEAAAAVPAEPPEATVASVAASPRCLAWASLDEGLFGEVEARLKGAGVVSSDYEIHLQKRLGWWVYLPPFATPDAARAAMDAARTKGVREIALVRGGTLDNAVALGAFPTLAKARIQMEALRALGIQGARIGPRPEAGSARLVLADGVPDARLSGLGQGWSKGRVPTVCAGN